MKTLRKLRKMMLTRQSSAQLQRMIFQKNMNADVDIITTTMANADVDTTIMTMNAVAQTMTRRNVAAVTTTATDL